MAAAPTSATILENCRVSPPLDRGSAAEQTLILTYFDMPWLHFHPVQRLLFYQIPFSKTHFLQTIVPAFKKSLSQTLQHFLPLAGNLYYPLNSGMPEIRYVSGDSVSVTVAESTHDFSYLSANNPRDADEFYAFFPDFPPLENETESGFQKIPLLAVQITLFPAAGISIGFKNNHAVGDASSIVGFIKAWSAVAMAGGDDQELVARNRSLLPIYDRSAVKDPSDVLNFFWNQVNHPIESSPSNLPTNKVRTTYILRKTDIQKLRNTVQAKKPDLIHLSSFTITAAYVWSCLAKSSAESGEDVAGDEPEYFAFAVDVRQRTEPPIPAAYFGNCIGLAVAESAHSELKGDEGFSIAVELIGDVIGNKVNDKEEIVRDAAESIARFGAMIGKRLFGVAGSPKFDLYGADFGWGKPVKFESINIDRDGSMSLCKSREYEGGLEIGLSLGKKRMDAFADVFARGLRI